jgi:hypothetical protein
MDILERIADFRAERNRSPQPTFHRVLVGTFSDVNQQGSQPTYTHGVRHLRLTHAHVSFLAGSNIASANPHCRNSASASTAASYKLDAAISKQCGIPSESIKETEHARAVGMIPLSRRQGKLKFDPAWASFSATF